MSEKEMLKKLFQYREDLEASIKVLEEEGDDRYPKSFIDGMVVGLSRAVSAFDATVRLIKGEEHGVD